MGGRSRLQSRLRHSFPRRVEDGRRQIWSGKCGVARTNLLGCSPFALGENFRSEFNGCMKTRRHHNNDGRKQIQSGGTTKALKRIAKKLHLRFVGAKFKT